MSRRLLLYGLFAAVAVSSTGCCGIIRTAFWRLRCCPGGAYPSFEAPGHDAGPAFVGPAFAGPVFGGGPGCAACYTPPPDHGVAHAPPVYAPPPVFNGASYVPPPSFAPPPVGSTPLPAPTILQSIEPPGKMPGK